MKSELTSNEEKQMAVNNADALPIIRTKIVATIGPASRTSGGFASTN